MAKDPAILRDPRCKDLFTLYINNLVEVAGLEPASGKVPAGVATGLVDDFFLGRLYTHRQVYRLPSSLNFGKTPGATRHS